MRNPIRGTAVALAMATLMSVAIAQEEEPLPEPREVELRTADGMTLKAQLYEPRGGGETKPAIVALHMEGADCTTWAAVAPEFARRGFSLLAVDMRGHGGSRTQGGEDLGPKVDARDPDLFNAMVNDALAGVAYARGSLLADGKKIGVLGAAAGGSVAIQAAKKDKTIAAVMSVSPASNACGITVANGLGKWDGRPIALFSTTQSPLGDLKKLERALAKKPRTAVIVLEGPAAAGTAVFETVDGAGAHVVQWFNGWFNRPKLDGKPSMMNVRESSGPGHIVANQSSHGVGMGGGGGIGVHGYQAPGKVTGVAVMVHPDPKANRLSKASRRIFLVPGKGKELSVKAIVQKWGGKSWKKHRTVTLHDVGGFTQVRNVSCYDVWLPPDLLEVPPFTEIAITSCLLRKGKPTWKDEDDSGVQDLGSFGGARRFERKSFRIENPSTWGSFDLR